MVTINHLKAFVCAHLSGAAATTILLGASGTVTAGLTTTSSDSGGTGLNASTGGTTEPGMTITVASTSSWRAQFTKLICGTEQMLVLQVLSATQAIVLRAYNGSTQAAHALSAVVAVCVPGIVGFINVNTAGTSSTLTVYDNPTAGSGTVLAIIDTTVKGSYQFGTQGGAVLTGLTVVTTDDATHHADITIGVG